MGLPVGYAEMHNYKHPKPVKLKLALFWVEGAGDPSAKLILKADELLKPHNFSLEAIPKVRTLARTLKWSGKLDISPEIAKEQALALRNLCHAALPAGQGLPVIFAPFADLTTGDPCRTTGWTIAGTNWLPFVVINADKVAIDNVTLLHEIGHAILGPGHPGEAGSLMVKMNFCCRNFAMIWDFAGTHRLRFTKDFGGHREFHLRRSISLIISW